MSILGKIFNAISKEIEISNLDSREGLTTEYREKQRELIERKYSEFGGSDELLNKALIFERDEAERIEAEARAEAKAKRDEDRVRYQLRKEEAIQKLKEEKRQIQAEKEQLEETLNNIINGGTTI